MNIIMPALIVNYCHVKPHLINRSYQQKCPFWVDADETETEEGGGRRERDGAWMRGDDTSHAPFISKMETIYMYCIAC